MQVRVITIDREFGCGAGQIARLVADRLDWKLWDQLLTSEIARRAECDNAQVQLREERMDPLYYRLLKSVLRGSFEGSLIAPRLGMLDSDTIFRLTDHVVRDAVAEGNCVIVGRGAAYLLQNRDDAFHTFLYAPRKEKIRRLIKGGTRDTEAEHLVNTVDRDRADFVKKYFAKEWPDRYLYHLMINSQIGDEAVTQMILNGIDTLQRLTKTV